MELLTGDCLELLPTLDAESIDAIVTDPPYGIGFMGHEWDQPGSNHGPLRKGPGHSPGHPREREARRFVGDHTKTTARATSMEAGRYDLSLTANRRYQGWCEAWAGELLRVAKPGAHLLVFGSTRTSHRLAAGLEDAGWEIRDTLVWGYASGFPKSLDISKAIDRAAGATREVIGRKTGRAATPTRDLRSDGYQGASERPNTFDASAITAPATSEAEAWAGWGTALKPAWEPIILARRPIRGTVAANVLAHGTGALNIDAARIGFQGPSDRLGAAVDGRTTSKASGAMAASPDAGRNLSRVDFTAETSPLGRWPANVVLTDPIFDGGIEGVVGGGEQQGGGNPAHRISEDRIAYQSFAQGQETGLVPVDTAGTYSRFFLVAKASRADREPLVGGQIERAAPPTWSSGEQSPGTFQSQPTPPRENVHPTVKPLELMRHLVRLVTPAGGIVLDPFLGSGTTALAAELEGFGWVGIEREPQYVAIALARLNGTQRGLGIDVEAPTSRRSRSRGHWPSKRSPHKQGAIGSTYPGGQTELIERVD